MNTQAQEQDFEDEIETPEVETDGFDIEVVDDTPEEDRGKPRRPEGAKPQVPEDDELESYSEGVQKRIKQLRYEFHEERRNKEEAARLREEALRFAEQMKQENDRLRMTLEEGEGVLINQAKGRLTAELDRAKAQYRAAYESGDPDALLEAQEKLGKLQYEQAKLDGYKPAPRQPAPVPNYQPVQQQPQVPKPDERAQKWAERNTWFQRDSEMTGYAYGLHEKLIREGIDPSSQKYYDEIDRAVRRVFPDRFDDGQIEEGAPQRQAGPVVAPATRSGKKPRKVQLTSTQVALAKRLGLTKEQYAAQLLKELGK